MDRLVVTFTRTWIRGVQIIVVLGACGVGCGSFADAGDIISPPYRGPRLGNVQCLVRNDTQRMIYAIPEWIGCTGTRTVSRHGGKELVPGENYNLVTTDPRACRCRVIFDGVRGDISMLLASGTAGQPAERPCH